MKLTEQQWKLINEISLRIHSIQDLTEMRQDFLSIIGALIQYDAASFYIQEGDNPYSKPIGVGLTKEDFDKYIDEYQNIDPFSPLMNLFGNVGTAIKTTDYAVSSDIESSDYYKKVWEPKGIKYAVLAPLSSNDEWYGSINLFRNNDKEDFNDIDMSILDILKEHMLIRLKKEKIFKKELYKSSASKSNSIMEEYGLTFRECEVISLTTRGLTDLEICEEMSISKNTLKKHISNIYSKLNISTRVELLKIINK